jgi:hypothetical protein
MANTNGHFGPWADDYNVENFRRIVNALYRERTLSRAGTVEYLIERVLFQNKEIENLKKLYKKQIECYESCRKAVEGVIAWENQKIEKIINKE